MKTCGICGKEKAIERFNSCGMCKSCHRNRMRKKRREFKLDYIAYLGGICLRCGYKEHPAAMDFHHIDPSQKEFHLGKYQNKLNDKVRKELDKCVLLCANCHRILHYEEKNT